MDPKIMELIRQDPRYAYEAYEFVCDSVTFTQERLGRRSAERPVLDEFGEVNHHVSGGEILRGACEFAVQEFGMMAPVVFRQWGIRRTDDFGELVFRLIEIERLSKSENDDPEDFRDVFEIERALTDGFELTIGEATGRGEI